MRQQRGLIKRHSYDDHFNLSFGDLFAGMVGVAVLLILFMLLRTNSTSLDLLKAEKTFSQRLSEKLVEVHSDGGYSEAIYVEPDHILIPMLNYKKIPLGDISIDLELKSYLRHLYLDQNKEGLRGQVLLIISNGSNASLNQFMEVQYELARMDKRFTYSQEIWIHQNLDFVIDPDLKAEFIQKWNLQNE